MSQKNHNSDVNAFLCKQDKHVMCDWILHLTSTMSDMSMIVIVIFLTNGMIITLIFLTCIIIIKIKYPIVKINFDHNMLKLI